MTHDISAPTTGSFSLTALSVALLFALAVACTPSTDTAATSTDPKATTTTPGSAEMTASIQPPAAETPQVLLPDGFEVTLELAVTPDELAQGLMFRPRLAGDRGMLLVFAEERFPTIWMMNTLVALDLVYLDSTGTVVDIITDAQPCPEEPCPRFTPKKPAMAVLEIPAGTATRHAISRGAKLEFIRVTEFDTGD
jgi:uncharacterized membrane protein (UPF0127 family)